MAKVIQTENAPAAIGPYVQAVDLGNMLFVSGQIPIIPESGEMSTCVKEQAKQSLANVKAIITSAGYQVSNIVKTTIFLADMNDFAAVNAVYEAFFIENNAGFTARSCVQVARIPKDAKVEIEVVAAK
ncbi:reactive intermediate/imine deaminase [Gilliamella sp. B2776]|uniref:Rid family detoxifying hydrolase n=1 Tax=unclassified Gilliamella TaxID=2685620 RepID=UPI00226A39B8|nr:MULTISPECIES: Rid family detoxifying hydrolase [unclassified Gilliamella]MCX8650380.1 reactive intermediate/imine deaminase [Gilliamella sp. B2779]MCX8654647.1 reactive intermediate/imine deaminase [Gilliamella sp. B2737]MCX8656688.1 reactive intermediate/imine deaminase [Gilliamella sp. B2894]MCX8665284.1 reactive intermediate/imine deaminase [Gilliamella sp. B2887]MCX8692153.1 reactive intermediate/imine deaminase [Gilliamella sp. B2776]